MTILFVIKNTANLRTLAPVVRALAERGHTLRIACRDVKSAESRAQMEELVADSPNITLIDHPFVRESGWSDLAAPMRRTIDYLRYLEPVYRDAPKLRARAESEAPPAGRRLGSVVRPIPGAPAAARWTLEGVERCIEPPPRAVAFLAEERPDVMMITPLIGFGTFQADLVRAAKRLGIPVCFPVRSWDNLTNKGLLREPPDQVLVWNDLQKQEAVELHGVPAESVVVTGAPAYDHWFDWQPGLTREEFGAAAGLDPSRPIVLYAGSSEFIAPDEPAFVRRWVEAVRAQGGSLADAGLLVRPHPLAASGFHELRIDDPQVSVWPGDGEFPLAGEARQNYFDSIYHSDAVVGINTSAQIEAAIVGRPVYTILAEEFAETQQGTLHFRYLADEEFGHLHAAATLEEHAAELQRAVDGDVPGDLNERFLLRFVRPFGLDVSATPRAADAIEELAARGPLPEQHAPALAPAVRLALRPFANHAAAERRRQKEARQKPKPEDELKLAVRTLARSSPGSVLLAGPWLGDPVHELLYWIPFLRWSTVAVPEVKGRLAVVARRDSAHWYSGLAARILVLEDGENPGADVVLLEPALVERQVEALAGQQPFARLHDRRLDFAPLPVPDGDLPGEARTAAIARSGSYTGAWGADACLAVLLGFPATVTDLPEQSAGDFRLLERLAQGPFGAATILDREASPAGVA